MGYRFEGYIYIYIYIYGVCIGVYIGVILGQCKMKWTLGLGLMIYSLGL